MSEFAKKVRRYLTDQENLYPVSCGVTLLLLLLIFGFAHIFGFTSTIVPEEEVVRIELRERVNPPPVVAEARKKPKMARARGGKKPAKRMHVKKAEVSKRAKPKVQSADISSLIKNFNPKKFVKTRDNTRRTAHQKKTAEVSLTRNLRRSHRNAIKPTDMTLQVNSRPTPLSGGKRGFTGAPQNERIDLGEASSHVGTVEGISRGITGGAGTGRATRSIGGGEGAAVVAFSGEGRGPVATLDILELIEWMKAHPGPIPALVGYEMGHTPRIDLSSAVKFRLRSEPFTLFLSVNEKELLLRICLVHNDDFTLLKDNGIKESSNFLTVGGVMREAGGIKSLISSRKAPEGRAAAFYRIFWSWWEVERAKM